METTDRGTVPVVKEKTFAVLRDPAFSLMLAVLLVGAFLVFGPANEADSFWHVLMGRDILQHLRLTGDPSWTYGPADPDWVTTQSGSEVGMWLLYSTFGWSGLVALRTFGELLMLISVGYVGWLATPRRWRRWSAPAVTASFGLAVIVQERPQLITFILLPIVGLWILRGVHGGRWIPAPIVFIVIAGWTWLHGGALLAAALIVASVVGRWIVGIIVRDRQLPTVTIPNGIWRNEWLVAAAAIIATFATPVGANVWERLILIDRAASGTLDEWGPAGVGGLGYVLIVLCVLVLAWRRRWRVTGVAPVRMMLLDAVIFLPIAVYGMSSVRGVLVAGLLSVPLVAQRGSQVFGVRGSRKPTKPRAVFAVVSVALLVAVTAVTVRNIMEAAPSSAELPGPRILTGLVNSTGDRNVFHEHASAGLIELLTRPGVRVAFDGRADRYGHDTLIDVFRSNAGDTSTLFTEWGDTTDVIVLQDSPLAKKMAGMGWRETCRDGNRIWFTKPGMDGECGSDRYPSTRRD